MKALGLHHIAIMTKDLEKAGKLFSDLFGVEFAGPYDLEALDGRYLSSPSLGINLAAPLTPDGPSARFLERRGEGVTTVVISVPDIEEAVTHMEAHGIRLVGREFRPNGQKTATYHPKDLCGVFIELMEE